MPTTVMRKPDVGAGFTGAAMGLQGVIAGAEAVEDKRRYDEQMAEGKRQFDVTTAEGTRQFDVSTEHDESKFSRGLQEGSRQFNVDQQFQQKRLRTMVDEAKLDRSHEQTMQVFEEGENWNRQTRDLGQMETESRREEATKRYQIKKDAEARARADSMQRSDTLKDDVKMYQMSSQIRSSIGKPTHLWTAEDWNNAYQAAYDQILGEGATTGAPDVPQATPEQMAEVRKRATYMIVNNDAVRDKINKDALDAYEAKQQVDARYRDPGTAMRGLEDGGLSYSDIVKPGEWAKDDEGNDIPGLVALNDETLAESLPPSTIGAMSDTSMGIYSNLSDISLRSPEAKAMVLEYGGAGIAPDSVSAYMADRASKVQAYIDDQMERSEYKLLPKTTRDALRTYFEQEATMAINYALADAIISTGVEKSEEEILSELGLTMGVQTNPAVTQTQDKPATGGQRSSSVR